MKRKRSSHDELSKRERQLMDVVFSLGEATVTQVCESMVDPPTRTTVRTLLRILEEKGHLKHRSQGREFVYQPTRAKSKEGQSAMRRVVSTFFGGSFEQAVAAHLTDPTSHLESTELKAIEKLIREAKKRTSE